MGSEGRLIGIVRSARRVHSTARAAESVLLAIAGACSTLAAAVASGATSLGGDVWSAGLLGGLACGAAWWYAHRAGEGELARELDRRGGHRGALLTAWEWEAAERPSPLARILAIRVGRGMSLGRAVRMVLPSSAVPIAAPFAAAACLAMALDLGRSATAEASVLELSRGLSAILAGAAGEAVGAEAVGDLQAGDSRRVAAVAREATRVESALCERDPAIERALAGLETLEMNLRDLARRLPRDGELGEGIDRARVWAEAARTALEGGGEVSPPSPPPAGAGAEVGEMRLSPGATEGTMSGGPAGEGPDLTESPLTEPPLTQPPHIELGVAGAATADLGPDERGGAPSRWWPSRFDGIVEFWVEERRGSTPDSTRDDVQDED